MLRFLPLLAVLLISLPVYGDELDDLGALSQEQFTLLAEDLSAVLGFRGLQPAEPYGAIGFDVGFDVGSVQLGNEAVWQAAGADVSTLPFFRVSATKGLPFGFDVGGFIASAPGASMRNMGAQLRYALIEGGVVAPAVGLRAAVTRMDGVDQLDYDTRSLDISISKGFGPLTPYAGYGRIWANADPDATTGLVAEDVAENRQFVGVRMTFVVLQFVLEADQVGDTRGYAAKIAVGF